MHQKNKANMVVTLPIQIIFETKENILIINNEFSLFGLFEQMPGFFKLLDVCFSC